MKSKFFKNLIQILIFSSTILTQTGCDKTEENKLPTCTITSPSNGIEIVQGGTVTISVNANDIDGCVSEVRFYIDNSDIGSTSSSPFNFDWETSDQEIGTHSIEAIVKDNSGSFASDEIEISLIPEIFTDPKNCEELKAQGVIDSFPYPIRPGSPEWKSLINQAEKLEALSVPENILQNMCTHGLVYTCVYCPFFFHLTIFNHIRDAFESLSRNINSFGELLKRDDAGKELFDYYKTLLPNELDTTWHISKQIHFQWQIKHTEIFFAQQEYLSKLNNTELQEVLIEAYNKLKEKEENKLYEDCIYGSYYLMSNIEYHNLHYEPLIDFIDRNNMSPFLNDCRWGWFDNQTLDSLKYYTELYILEFLQ